MGNVSPIARLVNGRAQACLPATCACCCCCCGSGGWFSCCSSRMPFKPLLLLLRPPPFCTKRVKLIRPASVVFCLFCLRILRLGFDGIVYTQDSPHTADFMVRVGFKGFFCVVLTKNLQQANGKKRKQNEQHNEKKNLNFVHLIWLIKTKTKIVNES